MSEVRRESVDYLIDGLVPLGMLTILAGDPGLGKSMLTCAWAATVSQTRTVVMLNAEDSYGAVIRPRLEAAGADLERVFYLAMAGDLDGLVEGIRLPDDVGELDRLVGEYEAALVVVDPITAHLSADTDSHRDTSVRQALRPLYSMAERRGCSVLLCVHQNKGAGTDPLQRTSGSIAFPATVRSQLLLARDPDSPDGAGRVLAHTKSNVGVLAESTSWRIAPVTLAAEDGMPETITARLLPDGSSRFSGRDLLASGGGSGGGALEEAMEFLGVELENGPQTAKDTRQAADKAGISDRTLDRAKERLGVVARREGGRYGSWVWALPSKDATRIELTPETGWRPLTDPKVTSDVGLKDAESFSLALFGDDVRNPE